MFGNILNYILGLGAAIFLPIIMIIIGLIIKMKFKRAIISGLTLGVAFTGMNVVLGFMFDTISPVASAFVEKTGIQLNIIDVGWSPMSAIAWAWPYALFMFPLQIGINLLMLIFKQTNILNVDLWNVWGKIFTATMVTAITGNIALGFVAAAIQVIVELKIGEATQKRTQEITGIPGVTCTHYMTLQCAIMEPVNKLLDYIPLFKKENANADKLKDKIGIFGDNSVMGFIIGGLIATLGVITALNYYEKISLMTEEMEFFIKNFAVKYILEFQKDLLKDIKASELSYILYLKIKVDKELGHTVDEISKRMNVTKEYIEKLEKLFDNVELDEMIESGQILEKANKITQMYILENIPKKLSYIDERILVMSYGLDDKIYSESEIAKSLNIAKHNVNILKEKALNKLSIDLLKNEFMKNSEETDYTVN